MLTAQYARWVGVAPGTTTLTVPPGPDPMQLVGVGQELFLGADPATLTPDQYYAADIKLRREALAEERKSAFWARLSTFATASLTTIALIAALSAWKRTGKIQSFVK